MLHLKNPTKGREAELTLGQDGHTHTHTLYGSPWRPDKGFRCPDGRVTSGRESPIVGAKTKPVLYKSSKLF